MRSFVIQKHTKKAYSRAKPVRLNYGYSPTRGEISHFDLMLEEKGKLLTWSANNASLFNTLWKLTECRKLPDHRIDYLTYQGKLSRGRGYVSIWDKGEYLLNNNQSSFFTLRLKGTRTKGTFFLMKDTKKEFEWWIVKVE